MMPTHDVARPKGHRKLSETSNEKKQARSKTKNPKTQGSDERRRPRSFDVVAAPLLMLNKLVSSATPRVLSEAMAGGLGDTAALAQEHGLDTTDLHEYRFTRPAAVPVEPNYGRLCPHAMPTNKVDMAQLAHVRMDTTVTFLGRVHAVRSMGARLVFMELRWQLDTVQCVVEARHESPDVSVQFVRWARSLPRATLVQVQGVLVRPAGARARRVKNATLPHAEVRVQRLFVVAAIVPGVHVASAWEEAHGHASQYVTHLRTPAALAVARVSSTVCQLFRASLLVDGFIEVHTPALQPTATESGAAVFGVDYFGRRAYLAQSPQLAKQECIAADFGRVFQVGRVFRAEKSNTRRHLAEFTSLDFEMALDASYAEILQQVLRILRAVVDGVGRFHAREEDVLRAHFGVAPVAFPARPVVLTFRRAVEMLNDDGFVDPASGRPQSPLADLSTAAEQRLGALVKATHASDVLVVDQFPAAARPFYTQRAHGDARYTNSFDVLVRGQEVCTGGQRVTDPAVLRRNMRDAGVRPAAMREYLQGFDLGARAHGGAALGLERLVALLYGLPDVRDAALFPRDPQSFSTAASSPQTEGETAPRLPHPEADTVRHALAQRRSRSRPRPLYLPVEHLIANYGDASNTAWLDRRWGHWRDEASGGTVGFTRCGLFAVVLGDPLCDARQLGSVVAGFLDFVRAVRLRPLWLQTSARVEALLAGRLGWRSLSCTGEARVDLGQAKSKAVRKKERQARAAGVTLRVVDRGDTLDDDLVARCDRRIADWHAHRRATRRVQVHATDLAPWIDRPHRRYVVALDAGYDVAALVVLADLAPCHGAQVKFALDFPGAPPGAIELAVSRALALARAGGASQVTFGASAAPDITFGASLHGTLRARLLQKTYAMAADQMHLHAKADFRRKFGARDEPLYLCYPRHGLGLAGTRTIVNFFKDV